MGSYTQNLFKRKMQSAHKKPTLGKRWVASCALIRDGVEHSYGFRSHAEIRRRLGDENARRSNPGDTEGFLDNNGTFMTRSEANVLAAETGQCQPLRRPMLSADIDRWTL